MSSASKYLLSYFVILAHVMSTVESGTIRAPKIHNISEQKLHTDTENATIPNRKMAGASVREIPSTQKQLPATPIHVKVCLIC